MTQLPSGERQGTARTGTNYLVLQFVCSLDKILLMHSGVMFQLIAHQSIIHMIKIISKCGNNSVVPAD